MKEKKNLSINNLLKPNNRAIKLVNNNKNNLLVNNSKPLNYFHTFSLSNITIKSNNKNSIEINKNDNITKRAFSPKNKVLILENQIKIIKSGNLFNSLKNKSNIKKHKNKLEKNITILNNNIKELKKKRDYQKINRFLVSNENIKIKNLHKKEGQNSSNFVKEKIEDIHSVKILENKINKITLDTKLKKENIIIIKKEVNKIKEDMNEITNKNNALNKQKNDIINKINDYNKKIYDLKIKINKFENLSDQLLYDMEGLIKLSNS